MKDDIREELVFGMYQGQPIRMQHQVDGQIKILHGTTYAPTAWFKNLRTEDIGTVGGVAPLCGLGARDVWNLAGLVDHVAEEYVNADLLASSCHLSEQQKQTCRELFSALSDNVWKAIKDIVGRYDPEKAKKTLHSAAATRRSRLQNRIYAHERTLEGLRSELNELNRQEAANG